MQLSGKALLKPFSAAVRNQGSDDMPDLEPVDGAMPDREVVDGDWGVHVVKLQCYLDISTQNIAMFPGIEGPGELWCHD